MKVKGLVSLGILAAVLFGLVGPRAAVAGTGSVCDPGNRITVLVRSENNTGYEGITSDLYAYIDPATDQAIVPVRAFVEALSGSDGAVNWVPSDRTATFQLGYHSLSIRLGEDGAAAEASIDDQSTYMTAHLCSGRIFAPARTVADALGVNVEYSVEARTLIADAVRAPVQNLVAEPVQVQGTWEDLQCGAAPSIPSMIFKSREASSIIACRVNAKKERQNVLRLED